MKKLLAWFDHRSGLIEAGRQYLDRPVPGGPSWLRVWPSTILFTFLVQAVTGFVLWSYYSPSDQSAWESVYYIQHEVAGGWLLRAMHHWSAQVALVLIGIYALQMILTGAYRAPREMVFGSVVLLGGCALGLLLTGDLLAWDQNSYASTHVRVSFLKLLPWIGDDLFKIAIGGPGPGFGHLTLPRFLALHVGLFTAAFAGLFLLHGLFRHRADQLETATPERSTSYWPSQAMRNNLAAFAVFAVIMLLSLQNGVNPEHAGVELGSPADLDPANKYAAARPEWAFLGLYEFAHLFPGSLSLLPIFVIPGLLFALVLAMPWIARTKPGHYFNVVLILSLLAGLALLSVHSIRKDLANEEHQLAIVREADQARRVRLLALGADGIPGDGALSLLRNDPKTQGPKLFAQHCASCHAHVDAEGRGIPAEDPSAPNLYGFADRAWLVGLLDPERIATAEYFGNTAFRGGAMVDHVQDALADLFEDEKEEVESLAIALSAEAELPAQREADARDTARIAEGKTFMVNPYGCTGCHKFHDKGRLGGAPDLTGYGSREWTIGIINDPAHPRFYGDDNDRMPAYAESDDPAENLLSARDIGLLADWLRGAWYEPE